MVRFSKRKATMYLALWLLFAIATGCTLLLRDEGFFDPRPIDSGITAAMFDAGPPSLLARVDGMADLTEVSGNFLYYRAADTLWRVAKDGGLPVAIPLGVRVLSVSRRGSDLAVLTVTKDASSQVLLKGNSVNFEVYAQSNGSNEGDFARGSATAIVWTAGATTDSAVVRSAKCDGGCALQVSNKDRQLTREHVAVLQKYVFLALDPASISVRREDLQDECTIDAGAQNLVAAGTFVVLVGVSDIAIVEASAPTPCTASRRISFTRPIARAYVHQGVLYFAQTATKECEFRRFAVLADAGVASLDDLPVVATLPTCPQLMVAEEGLVYAYTDDGSLLRLPLPPSVIQ